MPMSSPRIESSRQTSTCCWNTGASTMASRRLTDAEILVQIPAARAREARERKQGLRATHVKFDRRARRVVLELTSGYSFAFPVSAIRALKGATDTQLSSVELDPSGIAVCWGALDIDLSVPG